MSLQNAVNNRLRTRSLDSNYTYEQFCDFEATEGIDLIGGYFARDLSGTGARGNNVNNSNPANRPGIHAVEAGTTTTGRCAYRTNNSAYSLGNGVVQYMSDIAIPALSDATNTFTVRSGLISIATGDGTDGVFFRYTHGTNSGNWQAVCRNASSETVINSSVAVAIGDFTTGTSYKLEFTVNTDATSVSFSINGASIGSITTNIPATAKTMGWLPVGIIKSAGTTNRTVNIDRTALRIDFTTLRP